MGKRGKAARKRRRENEVVSTFASTATSDCQQQHEHEWDSANEGEEGAAVESSTGQHEISDAALQVTVATLHRLCGLVDVTTGKLAIKDKRYRSLRKVLYELQNSTGIHASGLSLGSSGINGVPSDVGMESINPTTSISLSKITREISSQIENDAWELAVVTLRNIRKRQEANSNAVQGDANGKFTSQYHLRPKLGAVQRWVRQLDAAGTDNPLALEVLDAILRVVSPESIIPVEKNNLENATWARLGVNNASTDDDREFSEGGSIRQFPPFDRRVKELNSLSDDREEHDIIDSLVSCMEVGDDGIRRISSKSTEPQHQSLFRQCGFEKGEDRKPPNHHDLVLVTTAAVAETQALQNMQSDGTIDTVSGHNMLLDNTRSQSVVKTPLPYIQGSFLLENVLTPTECDRLIASAEMAGFYPDEPTGEQPGASILAHACVWIVDNKMERTIFERVKKFLPSYEHSSQEDQCSGNTMETFQPLGLNRRFRFYRYVPGRYYRPHIDGAWPPSGFDQHGNYRYDISDHSNKNGLQFLSVCEEEDRGVQQSSSPDRPRLEHSRRRQLSRLTFLIYLNDDFDGGHTTFFVPAAEKEGILNAFPITPVRGCILVFPHGTCAAPLHEGSPVLRRAKYVVRTEVEYYV